MPSPRRSRLRPKPRHPQSRTAGRPNIGQFTGVESNPNLADLDPDTRFSRDDRCLDHEQFDDIESVSSRNRAPFQGFPGRSQSSRARCRSRTSWLSAVGGYLPVTPEVMEELEQVGRWREKIPLRYWFENYEEYGGGVVFKIIKT